MKVLNKLILIFLSLTLALSALCSPVGFGISKYLSSVEFAEKDETQGNIDLDLEKESLNKIENIKAPSATGENIKEIEDEEKPNKGHHVQPLSHVESSFKKYVMDTSGNYVNTTGGGSVDVKYDFYLNGYDSNDFDIPGFSLSESEASASGQSHANTDPWTKGWREKMTATAAAGFSFAYFDNHVTTNPYINEVDCGSIWGTGTTSHSVYFSRNQYTIELRKDGGSGGTSEVSVYYQGALPNVSIPSKTGYTFGGYYWDASFKVQYYNENGKSVAGGWNYTSGSWFIAKWSAKSYSVTLNKQNGSGGTSSVTATYDSAMPNISVPTRNGYVFQGYFSQMNGKGTKYYDYTGESVTNCDFTSATTLYAYWTKITLDEMGGSGGTITISSPSYGSTLSEITPPIKTGYTFKGYYTGLNGSGIKYYDENGKGVKIWDKTTDTILYAYWSPNPYSVVFNGNGGKTTDNRTSTSQQFYYGTYQNLKANEFVRTGYTFKGWDTSSAGNTVVKSDKANVGNLKTGVNETYNYYAVWEANTYTIVFDSNGGSGNMASQTFTYDSEQPLNKNEYSSGNFHIKRTGYTFKGWSTSSTASSPRYTDGYILGTTQSNGTRENLAASGSVTLYAVWTANTYSISFNGNGATSGSMASQGVTYNGGEVKLQANSYIKTNYIFKGWNTAASGSGTTYLDKAVFKNITGNITLYAQWEETWMTKASTSLTLSGDETYLVQSVNDLAYIAQQVSSGKDSFSGKILKQTCKIDLEGFIWNPIGTDSSHAFKGLYDGGCFPILNLKTSCAKDDSGNNLYSYCGLFGYSNGAVLKNINIISGDVEGLDYVGSIVGYANTGLIENCRSGAIVKGNKNCGLVGYGNSIRISSCYNYGDVSGSQYVGGILGKFEGVIPVENNKAALPIIENCYSKCDIYASAGYAGGILGSAVVNGSEIKACGFDGKITGDGLYINSIAGRLSNGKITDCFANSNISTHFGGSVTTNSFIYTVKNSSTKKYIGSSFASWSVTASGQPLPAGFSWLGKGGDKLDTTKLEKLGYSG